MATSHFYTGPWSYKKTDGSREMTLYRTHQDSLMGPEYCHIIKFDRDLFNDGQKQERLGVSLMQRVWVTSEDYDNPQHWS